MAVPDIYKLRDQFSNAGSFLDVIKPLHSLFEKYRTVEISPDDLSLVLKNRKLSNNDILEILDYIYADGINREDANQMVWYITFDRPELINWLKENEIINYDIATKAAIDSNNTRVFDEMLQEGLARNVSFDLPDLLGRALNRDPYFVRILFETFSMTPLQRQRISQQLKGEILILLNRDELPEETFHILETYLTRHFMSRILTYRTRQ